MRQIKVTLILLLFIMIGCNNESTYSQDSINQLVYNGFWYVTYNLPTQSIINHYPIGENEVQYRLLSDDRYITSGDVTTNQFKIMKKEGEQFITVYTHDNIHQGLFPFKITNEQPIFAMIDYSTPSAKFVGLFHLDSNDQPQQIETGPHELTEFMIGVTISEKDQIYTLVYENDEQNLYKVNDSLTNFELIAKDVSMTLSMYKEEVCYIKDQTLWVYDKEVRQLADDIMDAWIIFDNYILEVNSVGDYWLLNLEDHSVVKKGRSFIGFDQSNDELIIYANDNMDRIKE